MKTTHCIAALRMMGAEGTSKPSRVWLPNPANQLPRPEAATTMSLSSPAHRVCQDLVDPEQSVALSLPLRRKRNAGGGSDQTREARRGRRQGRHNDTRRSKDGRRNDGRDVGSDLDEQRLR